MADWLEATLGKLYDNGTELELLGGLNFIGFTITRNLVDGRYDLAIPGVAAGGSTGQLQYNNSGALDGAAGITIVESETGLQLAFIRSSSANPAAAGLVRGVNNTTLVAARNVGNTADIALVSTDSSNSANYGQDSGTMGNWCARMPTGSSFQVVIAGVLEYSASATQWDFNSNNLVNVAKLNGATVAAPVEGTALTDADQTLNVSGGNNYVQSTALTASRTKTLGTSGSPETGEVITIIRQTTAAFTMPVVNGGGGGGTLYTFPASAKRVADFRYDGTNWVLAGAKRLA